MSRLIMAILLALAPLASTLGPADQGPITNDPRICYEDPDRCPGPKSA